MMPRIQSLDLARGFTVLFIPAIHTVMLYSKPEVYTTWLGYPLAFIAEGPGGQLFMLLMGIAFTFKIHHDPKDIFLKALGLLAVGYLLNILKFIVPYSMNLLPIGVVRDLRLSEGNELWQLFSMGDILHFAAIALMIIYGIYQIKYYQWIACIIAVIIVIMSPLFWDCTSENPIFNYILQLCTGQPPRTFFPLFPWLVYPLLGLTLGYYMKQNRDRAFRFSLIIGAICVAIGVMYSRIFHEHSPVGFYRTFPGETIVHIGIALLALFVWNWIANRIRQNHFFRVLEYMSEHITSVYIIQWIVICWLLPIIGYQTLSIYTTLQAISCITAITFILSILFNHFNSLR